MFLFAFICSKRYVKVEYIAISWRLILDERNSKIIFLNKLENESIGKLGSV